MFSNLKIMLNIIKIIIDVKIKLRITFIIDMNIILLHSSMCPSVVMFMSSPLDSGYFVIYCLFSSLLWYVSLSVSSIFF
jgi:hypothetical protein